MQIRAKSARRLCRALCSYHPLRRRPTRTVGVRVRATLAVQREISHLSRLVPIAQCVRVGLKRVTRSDCRRIRRAHEKSRQKCTCTSCATRKAYKVSRGGNDRATTGACAQSIASRVLVTALCASLQQLRNQGARTESPAVAPTWHMLVHPFNCALSFFPYLPLRMLKMSADDAPLSKVENIAKDHLFLSHFPGKTMKTKMVA